MLVFLSLYRDVVVIVLVDMYVSSSPCSNNNMTDSYFIHPSIVILRYSSSNRHCVLGGLPLPDMGCSSRYMTVKAIRLRMNPIWERMTKLETIVYRYYPLYMRERHRNPVYFGVSQTSSSFAAIKQQQSISNRLFELRAIY